MARRYSLQDAGKRLAEFLDREGAPSVKQVLDSTTGKDRNPGSAKGLFKVPDDFDAPVSGDTLACFS